MTNSQKKSFRSAETASEDDELESVSEAESNPNEDAKSYQSGEDLADQVQKTVTISYG